MIDWTLYNINRGKPSGNCELYWASKKWSKGEYLCRHGMWESPLPEVKLLNILENSRRDHISVLNMIMPLGIEDVHCTQSGSCCWIMGSGLMWEGCIEDDRIHCVSGNLCQRQVVISVGSVRKFSAGSQDSTSHHRLYRENSFKSGKVLTKKSSELLSHIEFRMGQPQKCNKYGKFFN